MGALSIVLFWIQDPPTLWHVAAAWREMVRRLK